MATIVLSDGVQRELRYTLASFRDIKRATGKSFLRDGAAMLSELDEEVLPLLIHSGLKEKTISVDQVAELISPSMLEQVVSAFVEAITESMPKPSEKNEQAGA